MDKVEFERQFDARLVVPLAPLGFQTVGRSLHARIGDAEIAIIRLGGRMVVPGGISHLLCVRKTWLRTRDERVPDAFVREPFDHPFKLRPSQLEDSALLRYTPKNGHYDYDSLLFAATDATDVSRELERLRAIIAERVVPWASALSPESLLKQIRENGENAWIERLWIEDCDARTHE